MDKINKLKTIRKYSIIIFIISTLFPGLSTKIIAIPSILVWLFVNYLIDKDKFIHFFIKPSFFMYSMYFWILTNFIYIVTGYSPQLSIYITTYIRIAITSIIYLYYIKSEDESEMKTIVITSLIIITIVNIITIIANMFNYNLSRVLSTSIALERKVFGVGAYPYVYSLIYPLLVILAYMVKNIKGFIKEYKTSKKVDKKIIIAILFTLITLYTIYITEFLISMMLVALGFVFIILKMDNAKKFMKYLVIMLIIVIALSPILNLVFEKISESTDSENIQIRAQDLHILFSGGDIENTVDLKERIGVYRNSIKAFMEYPLFGLEINHDSNLEVGEHSTILDQFGKYGIVCGWPFFLFLFALFRETYKSFEDDWAKRTYFICLTVFSICMLINTTLFISIFYTLFVMSPIMLNLLGKIKTKRLERGE